MGKNISKNDKRKKQQAEKLGWVLKTWDCESVSDAKRLAKTDAELRKALLQCGIKL